MTWVARRSGRVRTRAGCRPRPARVRPDVRPDSCSGCQKESPGPVSRRLCRAAHSPTARRQKTMSRSRARTSGSTRNRVKECGPRSCPPRGGPPRASPAGSGPRGCACAPGSRRVGPGTSLPGSLIPAPRVSSPWSADPIGSSRIPHPSAPPDGHARAGSTSSSGSRSITWVSSSISSGDAPTERRAWLPGAGQSSSTACIREVPTTHSGSSQLFCDHGEDRRGGRR